VLARANGGEPVVVAIAPDGGASYLADERRLLGEL
jgi:hypothetical protein